MARSSRIGGSIETLRRLDEVDPFITMFVELDGRTVNNWGKNCEHDYCGVFADYAARWGNRENLVNGFHTPREEMSHV